MNKKILILALMCVLSVSVLAGCGSNSEENKKTTTKEDKAKELTKGFEDFKNLKPTPHKGY
ncbi:MAG: hypothetical protein IJA79_09030 [Desulfovibrio sp.]|nr:hypothetical protein [Desulfovibrio sp.]